MNELIRRFRSETPAFWKKVQKRAALVGGGLGTLLAEGHAPEALMPYLKYALVACSIVALMAQLTCTDSSPSETAQ